MFKLSRNPLSCHLWPLEQKDFFFGSHIFFYCYVCLKDHKTDKTNYLKPLIFQDAHKSSRRGSSCFLQDIISDFCGLGLQTSRKTSEHIISSIGYGIMSRWWFSVQGLVQLWERHIYICSSCAEGRISSCLDVGKKIWFSAGGEGWAGLCKASQQLCCSSCPSVQSLTFYISEGDATWLKLRWWSENWAFKLNTISSIPMFIKTDLILKIALEKY